MDRLPELLTAIAALLVAIVNSLINIWQQLQISRAARRLKEVRQKVDEAIDNGIK